MLRTFTTVGLNFLAWIPAQIFGWNKKGFAIFLAHFVSNAFFLIAKSWQHCLWGHCAVTKREKETERGGRERKKGGEREEEERQICIYWAVYWLHCNCCWVICSQWKGNVSVVFFFRFSMWCMAEKKKLNERERLTARITVKICRNALKTWKKN